jgi:hypothetical protein
MKGFCTLTARELKARAGQWLQLVWRAKPRVALSAGRVVIRFADPTLRNELASLVSQERLCCSWLPLHLEEGASELILAIGGGSKDR